MSNNNQKQKQRKKQKRLQILDLPELDCNIIMLNIKELKARLKFSRVLETFFFFTFQVYLFKQTFWILHFLVYIPPKNSCFL